MATDDRAEIRARWDAVEAQMRAYLEQLQDTTLFNQPIVEPAEDKDLTVWQVLIHVINHGTDHRAQMLRQLHDLDDQPGLYLLRLRNAIRVIRN